jgi:ribonuclease PH
MNSSFEISSLDEINNISFFRTIGDFSLQQFAHVLQLIRPVIAELISTTKESISASV